MFHGAITVVVLESYHISVWDTVSQPLPIRDPNIIWEEMRTGFWVEIERLGFQWSISKLKMKWWTVISCSLQCLWFGYFFPEVREILGSKMHNPVRVCLGHRSLFSLLCQKRDGSLIHRREKITTSIALMDTKIVVFKSYNINIT